MQYLSKNKTWYFWPLFRDHSIVHTFQNMFVKKFNENKHLKDVKMVDFPVFAMCSVNREIMHTSHTLCWLALKKHLAYPDVAKMLNLFVHR